MTFSRYIIAAERMSARAAGDVRKEQRSAAAARQRQRRPRHGDGGGGGGSGAGPAATAAAMAAVGERRSLPSPEAMLGQPWSHWVDAAKLHGNDGERPPPLNPFYRPGPRSPRGWGCPGRGPAAGGTAGRRYDAAGCPAGGRRGSRARGGGWVRSSPNVAAEFVVRYAAPEAAAPPGRGLGERRGAGSACPSSCNPGHGARRSEPVPGGRHLLPSIQPGLGAGGAPASGEASPSADSGSGSPGPPPRSGGTGRQSSVFLKLCLLPQQ